MLSLSNLMKNPLNSTLWCHRIILMLFIFYPLMASELDEERRINQGEILGSVEIHEGGLHQTFQNAPSFHIHHHYDAVKNERKIHERRIKSLYKEALKNNDLSALEKEVRKGDPLAKVFLSWLLEASLNHTQMNVLRAKRLKHESIKKLEQFAQEDQCDGVIYFALAKLYEEGEEPSDRSNRYMQMTFYYQKAVEFEDDEAAVWLGTRYKLGDNTLVGRPNIEAAFSLYEKAADQKNLEAIEFLKEIAKTEKDSIYAFKVGIRFEEGRGGIPADDSIAMHFYERAMSSDDPSPETLFRLANLQRKYEHFIKAAELYSRLIMFEELYKEEARNFLDALCYREEAYAFYYRARVNNREGKQEGAVSDFQQAIQCGSIHLYDQACLYEELNQLDEASKLYNTLVEANHGKALIALQRLSEAVSAHAPSQFYLAKLLLEGIYIEKNIEKAHKLLRAASYAHSDAHNVLVNFFGENETNLQVLTTLTGCSSWQSLDALKSLVLKDKAVSSQEITLISQHLKNLKTLGLQLIEGCEHAVDDLIRNMLHLEKLDLLGMIIPDTIILQWFKEGRLSNLSVFGCQVHAEINGTKAFERLSPEIFSAPQHLLFFRLNTTGVGLGTEIGSQWIVQRGKNWIQRNLDDFESSSHLYRFWVPDHDCHSCNSPTVWASASETHIRYFKEKSAMGFIELTESVVHKRDWWRVSNQMESYMSCFGFMQLYTEGSVIIAPGTYFREKPWPKPGLVVWKHEA